LALRLQGKVGGVNLLGNDLSGAAIPFELGLNLPMGALFESGN